MAAGAAVLLMSGVGAAAPAAAAESKPITADLLPTGQTNGRVWALAAVGDVVFVGGDFSAVRPRKGDPAGSELRTRTNLAAFDAETGDLLPCAPTFSIGTGSVTVRALEGSPDGSRLYVGGSFSNINGTSLANLASLDVSTCTLTPSAEFRRPAVNARVHGLDAVGDSLYAVGDFTKVNDLARRKFASFSSGGALSDLDPAFSGSTGSTLAVLAAPDAGRVYVGGDFDTVNGTSARAIVALNLSDGSVAQTFDGWMPNTSVTKALVRSGDTFFLGAEGTGDRVFDGRLAANIRTGEQLWKDTCLGATQALAVRDGLLYSGSHAHDCSSTPGGFTDAGFRQHLLAQNISDKAIRHWFPDTNDGVNPGHAEVDMPGAEGIGPRALVFAGGDLWVGGEFTTVNDSSVPQWGLARFAGSPDTGTNAAPALTLSSTVAGKVNIRWTTRFDRDDESLIYELYRDGVLVNKQTSISKEWNRPVLSFTDTVTPGATASYRMRVLEADGENTGPLGAATTIVAAKVAVTVSASRSGYGNVLRVKISPDRGASSYLFRLQRLSRGKWTTMTGSYRSQGDAETRSIKLRKGVYRVYVPATARYSSAVSKAVTITDPTVKVVTGRDAAKSKLKVAVSPSRGSGYWTFRVQKRDSKGRWSTLRTTYKTQGTAETRTVDLRKGTYRVVVAGKGSYRGATGAAVTLVR